MQIQIPWASSKIYQNIKHLEPYKNTTKHKSSIAKMTTYYDDYIYKIRYSVV
jgi:hypothetical protein